MVNRALHLQEIEVFYILPALRRELALCMKERGAAQKEIAGRLAVTESAVSQYLSEKRAQAVSFSDSMLKKIRRAAGRIADELSLYREVQYLLVEARKERVMCGVHVNLGGIPRDCRVCFDGA